MCLLLSLSLSLCASTEKGSPLASAVVAIVAIESGAQSRSAGRLVGWWSPWSLSSVTEAGGFDIESTVPGIGSAVYRGTLCIR